MSPFAGGVAAVLGWIAAVVFRESMGEAEFAAMRFGWTGAMVGGVALATVLVLMFASDIVEPVVMAASAAFGAWLLWEQTELPFSTTNFEQSDASYWFAFTMMAGIFVLLLMGLRAARETTSSSRQRR